MTSWSRTPGSTPYNAPIQSIAETVLADNQAGWQWINPNNPTRAGWLEMNAMMNALPTAILAPEDIASGPLYPAFPLGRFGSGTVLDIALGSNARYTA